MKDAYSFDYTDAGLDASYQAQRDAYERIFTRLGLEYVVVKADAGAWGGLEVRGVPAPDARRRRHVRALGGRLRRERRSVHDDRARADPVRRLPEPKVLPSPNTPTIATLVDLANAEYPRPDGRAWTAADTLKNVVLALTHLDGTREVVVVGIPGDREIDDKRVEVAFAPAVVEAANDEDFARSTSSATAKGS